MSDVIEIRKGVTKPEGMPGPGESPLESAPYGQECDHASVRLDREARAVRCKRCDATVDAYDHLLALAQKWSRMADWVKHARRERATLAGRIAELKREERRVKARLKRAMAKLPSVEEAENATP
jgi:seryl-tRNA synthetase